jgi:hypothetical protein
LWLSFFGFSNLSRRAFSVQISAFCFLIFARSCLCCDSRYPLRFFNSLFSIFIGATSSSSFVSLPRIYRNASSASRITSGCTLFVQESLRLLACNALLGTLLFADFFAFISPTKVQKKNKYASKIMFIFLIFNSFYERQMRSDN